METSEKDSQIDRRLFMALLAALTLGLAPFFPEPHLIGKLRWLIGGGESMQSIDIFDLVLHGFPWVYFIIALALKIRALLA